MVLGENVYDLFDGFGVLGVALEELLPQALHADLDA